MGLISRIKSRFSNKNLSVVRYEMVTDNGNGFYMWNGNIYQSDIVRSCIRPKTQAIGKLEAKHIRKTIKKDGTTDIKTNPDFYMSHLLEEPNPYMTGQIMQEKMANQLALNNNAFALIIRDDNLMPVELFPIPCTSVEAKYDASNNLFLKFYLKNGKILSAYYTDIIHLRRDFNGNDIFGDSPAQALTSLMDIVSTADQGIVKAIKNGAVVKWIMKFKSALRPEDIKKQTTEFTDNYLKIDNEVGGVVAADSKYDLQQVEPKDYVPNAVQIDKTVERIYSFFNTNNDIIQSKWGEDEWNSYYESEIVPLSLQMKGEYTRKLFSIKQRRFGNSIIFEAYNLQCANIKTKLSLVSMVDRGSMTPNEWRETLNLGPIAGGDVPLRRLDTQQVGDENTVKDDKNDIVKEILSSLSSEQLQDIIKTVLKGGKQNE